MRAVRGPSRPWAAAGTAGLLVACNAVLGMDELPRASGDDGGRSGSTSGNGGTAGSGGSGAGAGMGESGQGQGGAASGGRSGGPGGGGGTAGSGGLSGSTSGGTSGTGGSGGGPEAGSAGTGGTTRICVPDLPECVDGRALLCNSDGSGYESDVLCTATQTCVDGMCVGHQCVPESAFCLGSDVRQCASDGLSSTVTEMCDTAEYCDTSSAMCEVGVCSPNEPACNVNVATTCNADGSDFTAGGSPCGTGTSCDRGVCKTHECAPDAAFCQGQELMRCAPNGLSSTVVETCDSDEYCTAQNGGSCQDQVCVPGTRTCSGNTSRLCNPTGSGTIDVACTGNFFCHAASGDCWTQAEVVGALDGRLIQIPCGASSTSDDCTSAGVVVAGVTTPCAGGSLTAVVNHPIGGASGKPYQVTIHFYGIVGPKNYGSNVTREAGNTRPSNLATGATPVPWASAAPGTPIPTSNYDTYEIHVLDQNGMEQAMYFVNSDTTEGRWSYVLDFTKTITVIGGGTVRVRVFDSNCRIIKNCTTGPYPCAAKARTVDTSVANPQPALTQPGLGMPDDDSGQWLLFDVTGVQ
jgi:hypothetical protein